MAPYSHCFTHKVHPMQPDLHASITAFPFSWDEQYTVAISFSGLNSIRFLGHALTHFPHEVQRFLSTTATPFTILMALLLHTFTHEPNPRHP